MACVIASSVSCYSVWTLTSGEEKKNTITSRPPFLFFLFSKIQDFFPPNLRYRRPNSMLRSIRRGYEGWKGLSFLREDKDYVISIRRNIGQIRSNKKRKRIKRAFHIEKRRKEWGHTTTSSICTRWPSFLLLPARHDSSLYSKDILWPPERLGIFSFFLLSKKKKKNYSRSFPFSTPISSDYFLSFFQDKTRFISDCIMRASTSYGKLVSNVRN